MCVLSPEKPRSLTFDAELVISFDSVGLVQTSNAVVNHYHAETEDPFVENALYYIAGKVACIDKTFPVGDSFYCANYDFVIDADTVGVLFIRFRPPSDCAARLRCFSSRTVTLFLLCDPPLRLQARCVSSPCSHIVSDPLQGGWKT